MSKKIIFFLMVVFSLGAFTFTACGSDDDDSVELVLAKTDINVEIGTTVTVKISKGNGGYVVKSVDESVATATVESNIITITGVETGHTTVTVTDKEGKTNSIAVAVPEEAPSELDFAYLVKGTYVGKLNITDLGIINADNNIVITKTGDNLTKLELRELTLQLGKEVPITIRNIAVDNVPVSLANDAYKLAKTTQAITVDISGVDATATVTVEGTVTPGGTLNLKIDVTQITNLPRDLNITFTGNIVP